MIPQSRSRLLRRIKTNLILQEYSRLYPTGSCPEKFYGTGKTHKILPTDNVDKLPIRPIVSNINTSTYELAKYLTKLLSPLISSGKWSNPGHFFKVSR